MNKSSDEFVFSHSRVLPISVASDIWSRWSSVSRWADWDQSLSGTQTDCDSITLGKRFNVIPKMSGKSVPVTVISSVEKIHFTTASVGPMGVMAIGHTLIVNPDNETVAIEHSICAVPSDVQNFHSHIWGPLQEGLVASVECLSDLVLKAAKK